MGMLDVVTTQRANTELMMRASISWYQEKSGLKIPEMENYIGQAL